MSLENNIRVLLFAFGLFAVLYLPWWAVLAVISLLSMRFGAWEAMLLGLLLDFLYLPAGHIPFFFIASLAIVWIFEPLRSSFLLQ